MRWRGAWLAAQLTGVVISTAVWIVIAGLSIPILVSLLGCGVLMVLGRNTRLGLWWRYGARAASAGDQARVLEVIVPIASLRGRRQPRIWVGTRLGDREAVMPTAGDVVLGRPALRRILDGAITQHRVCAVICRALGRRSRPRGWSPAWRLTACPG